MKLKFALATAVVVVLTVLTSAAGDGAKLYKKKCVGCHGASGEGKPAVKAPALAGTNLEASEIANKITKGAPGSKAPHNKGIAHLSNEHAKAIADYVKTLK